MNELTLVLESIEKESLSVKRLGEYLSALSSLVGDGAYLINIKSGSTLVCVGLPETRYVEVSEALTMLESSNPRASMARAWSKIKSMMTKDGTSGSILNSHGARLISFSHVHSLKNQTTLSITKISKVKGKVIGIFGDSSAPKVRLKDASGSTIKCVVSADLAKGLACLLYCPVEVVGKGSWSRDDKGRWELTELAVTGFSELQDVSATEAINRLRRLPGNQWKDVADISSVLADLRA